RGPSHRSSGPSSRGDQSDARGVLAQAGSQSSHKRSGLGNDGQSSQRHGISVRERRVLVLGHTNTPTGTCVWPGNTRANSAAFTPKCLTKMSEKRSRNSTVGRIYRPESRLVSTSDDGKPAAP